METHTTERRARKTLTVLDLKERGRTIRGQRHEGEVRRGHHAVIKPGRSITLLGNVKLGCGPHVCTIHDECREHRDMAIECAAAQREDPTRTYVRRFTLGDEAEYDSWNLSYIGTIVAISEKTVTIASDHRERSYRLTIAEFSDRNWNFDAVKTAERNLEIGMTL